MDLAISNSCCDIEMLMLTYAIVVEYWSIILYYLELVEMKFLAQESSNLQR